jgi:hypothetical protein
LIISPIVGYSILKKFMVSHLPNVLHHIWFTFQNITFESKVVRRMVSSARGQEWKDIRSSITPAFTTGKIKRVSPFESQTFSRIFVYYHGFLNIIDVRLDKKLCRSNGHQVR